MDCIGNSDRAPLKQVKKDDKARALPLPVTNYSPP